MFKFSVLMSLYDKEFPTYLNECFTSLSRQTLQANEIILVFDGPIREELRLVVNRWKQKLNIIVVELPENKGLANALNIGLEHCSFDYVARMDTDDICASDRFSKQMNFMKRNPNVDICGTWATDIDEVGNKTGIRKVPTEHHFIRKYIWACPFIHPSVIFKKASIEKCGSYRIDAPHRQDDYDLWIRCNELNLEFANIPQPLIFYRFPEGAEKKNTFEVGLNRFRIGFKPLLKYNPSLFSFFGLTYPMLRSILPLAISKQLTKFAKSFDPRSK
ncbi:glycosyltransferase [Vibrio alginolyticus]|uniref:glycosyltransferase n=1 Tax=Vibrio alginolyticus TaxID=663 RepID=UPI001BD6D015|nr:glycosyltransferase [Vibrio alginolyticus]EJG0480643.1 glycosyltransferase [Vibrio alginolyticus]MBS9947882.1 glycosyltransferase [Vibrio alginolyticus]